MEFIYSDGGRELAGFKGKADDCVCRSIAIVTGKPYKEVYDLLNKAAGKAVARTGVDRKIYEKVLAEMGWVWVPTMRVGQGCSVHLPQMNCLREGSLFAHPGT